MGGDDPDENPPVLRAAEWSMSGWADFGIIGALAAVLVAIWARARSRRRRA